MFYTSATSSQLWPWVFLLYRDLGVSTPGRWTWLLLSCLKVQPVVKLNMNRRHPHTHTHTKDTDTTGYTGCRRQGAAFSSTHVQDLDKTEVETAKISSSSLAGKDWNSVVKAHIQRSRFTSKCMFRDPQILEWPFWPFYTPFWTFLPNSLSLHPPPAVCIVLLTPPPLRPSGLHSYLLLSPRFGCSFLMTCQLVWLTRLFPIIVSIMLVCQVCISRFCLLLPPSLVIPFHIKKVFDQMTLTKQMLSPST